MIAKGLDFKKVTLVGVINADESLNIPDFRSGENTFSLLAQVAGRAVRSDLPGKVIIQSFNPDSKTLNFVRTHDYIGTYAYEMRVRKMLKYPPYCYLISLKVSSKSYDDVSVEANKIAAYLRRVLTDETINLGPTTATPFKINNVYRFGIVLKYRKSEQIKEALEFLDKEYVLNKSITLDIDVDPLRI